MSDILRKKNEVIKMRREFTNTSACVRALDTLELCGIRSELCGNAESSTSSSRKVTCCPKFQSSNPSDSLAG